MRLEKIKLAGFKSFVDPTTVLFPSNLVGVVGPNGCGKSNVIDAVRWVMGESSAKMLRGESMADVIFNGSTGRKPVGTAGIELVFDNTDSGAGGEFAQYSHISVKRQVSRDGQSAYFLNGTRCRRRDIQDLFLGTGLGPRSYAIIEQGMIARIIESKPEELRLFLEEAAGISKYKERRRETENRMRHTRDNLDRLDDLREEVSKQLLHLERQAATAEKYQRYKASERRVEAELKALRWRILDQEIEGQDRELAEQDNRQEQDLSRQRRIEADIEAKRDAFTEATDRFNEVQGRFYAVGSEIARVEQAIRFTKENRNRQQGEIHRLDQELVDARGHLARDEGHLAELEADLEQDEPALLEAHEVLEEAAERVFEAEEQLEAWETEWDTFNRQAAAPAEQAQGERARINHMEQRIAQDEERGRRIDEEITRLSIDEISERIETREVKRQEVSKRVDEVRQRHQVIDAEIADLEQTALALTTQTDHARTELQEGKGRQASLEALQDAALAESDDALTDWLEQRGLTDVGRLVDHLEVEPGWDQAVESVLADYLRALCTNAIGGHARAAQSAELGDLVLLDATGDPGQLASPDSLQSRVCSPWSLDSLLGAVSVADDLEQALANRAGLKAHERIVTPDGMLLGPDWIRIPGGDQALGGVIARAEELKSLQSSLLAIEDRVRGLEDGQARLSKRRTALRQERDQGIELGQLDRELSNLRSELTGERTRLEHQMERREALVAEREELAERIDSAIEEMEEARERLHELLESVEHLAEQREVLASRREGLRATVTQGREAERRCREQVQALEVSIQSRRASREATSQNLERARDQEAQLRERREGLTEQLEESIGPLADQEATLEEQLAARVEVEEQLGVARDGLETLDAGVREMEQERHRVEKAIAERQRSLDAVRMLRHERMIRRRTLEEQLGEDATSPAQVLQDIDPEASEDAWREELTKLGNRIQRLGAINLAAIDEYAVQSERKGYLDAQHDDISRSLETLEQAIRKIDRETRTRFKETYDQVNQGFQQLFPRLFGGGHAYLELTDEDLLETGVAVMARPPGKRNSSIHLLSGGEKALTAVGLVFSIFLLNPAPFCMLDEVDAPLDDANVERFSEMVRSMSDQVQFIFISHNKVTMEIAEHLLGVTMHEPGVSRLVSVDVEEAVRMAGVA